MIEVLVKMDFYFINIIYILRDCINRPNVTQRAELYSETFAKLDGFRHFRS